MLTWKRCAIALMMTLALPCLAQDEPPKPAPDKPVEDGAEIGAATKAKIDRLIGELGDRKYATREAATEGLIALGKVALPALREAAKDDDLEIRQRAQRAIDKITGVVKPKVKRIDGPPPPRILRLGPGGGLKVRIVQLGGGKQVEVDETDGTKTVKITEGGKTRKYLRKKDGAFEVTAAGKTHKFKDEAAFKKDKPKLHAEWKANQGGGAAGMLRIAFGPGGAGGGGALPPGIKKKLDDAMKKLDALKGLVPPKAKGSIDPTLKPRHGLVADKLEGALASHIGRENGALVTSVSGDLAGKLGLKVHDVVTKIGDRAVTTPAELYAALDAVAEAKPAKVDVALVRGGKALDKTVELAAEDK